MSTDPVVAGIDGSPAAEAAISWAAAEAAARSTTLRLVHAFVWPEFRVPLGGNDLAPGLRVAADKVVHASIKLARTLEPSVQVEGVLEDGFPSPVLIRASKSAGLVVIGSRDLGASIGVLLGSTGLTLAAHAQCPVVVVRSCDTSPDDTYVVVGYDGSPAASAALDFSLEHSRRHGLRLRVVAVREPHSVTGQCVAHDLRQEIQSHPGGESAEVLQVDGHPAEQLLRLSAGAQLMVVGSRGRGGFTGMLLGSVSQTILYHADCPVVVVR